MFVQKANPYHDPKTGRFTHGPGGQRVLTTPGQAGGYVPAEMSLMNPDGSINWDNARKLADTIDAYSKGGSIGELDQITEFVEADKSLAIARQLQGFNGKPRLIDEDMFAATAGDVLYRGDYDETYSQNLRSGVFFPNRGMGGNGTYSTKDISEALLYARTFEWEYQPDGSSREILKKGGLSTFKLDSRAKVYVGTADSPQNRFRSELERQVAIGPMSGLTRRQREVLMDFSEDQGRLLTALGYDAFIPGTGAYDPNDHVVVLNRTAMIILDNDPAVSESMLAAAGAL